MGATCFQQLTYGKSGALEWNREEGYSVLFTEVDYLDATISRSLQENYAFYRQTYSKKLRRKEWGNCCVHCQALQEEDGDWLYGGANPFSPWNREQAMEIRIIYFKLDFDYYIRGGYKYNPLLEEVIR